MACWGRHGEGRATLVLHIPGRGTGSVPVSPLVAAAHGDEYVICGGTDGGAPDDP
jgi:hypothetical protein